jgi:hypothetical protein
MKGPLLMTLGLVLITASVICTAFLGSGSQTHMPVVLLICGIALFLSSACLIIRSLKTFQAPPSRQVA